MSFQVSTFSITFSYIQITGIVYFYNYDTIILDWIKNIARHALCCYSKSSLYFFIWFEPQVSKLFSNNRIRILSQHLLCSD